ncbi:MAG TPA: hypothetical protein VHE81_20140, partial [Lacipirellulaceae bacterium]|nr:hypothetical protein [Lacipirellulaceae bacterium]
MDIHFAQVTTIRRGLVAVQFVVRRRRFTPKPRVAAKRRTPGGLTALLPFTPQALHIGQIR